MDIASPGLQEMLREEAPQSPSAKAVGACYSISILLVEQKSISYEPHSWRSNRARSILKRPTLLIGSQRHVRIQPRRTPRGKKTGQGGDEQNQRHDSDHRHCV